MKKVLIAFTWHGRNTLALFPRMLSSAGYDVTLMSSKKLKAYIGQGYSHWIESSDDPNEVICQIAEYYSKDANAFDWVILSDDDLLRALHDSTMPTSLKIRIGPIGDAEHLNILGSKCATADTCADIGICIPQSFCCHTQAEAIRAAEEIGYPVIIQIDHSLGSEGTFICTSQQSVNNLYPRLDGIRLQVEKFITGSHIRLDPLYFKGKLIAATASRTIKTVGNGMGVATHRLAIDARPYLAMLNQLGEKLLLNGFMSIGCIVSASQNELYLFELDCRPNPWPPLGDVLGVNFTKALLDFSEDPNFSILKFLSTDKNIPASLFWRDIPHLVKTLDIHGLVGWLTNRNQCWKTLPLHDPRLMLFWTGFVAGDICRAAYKKILRLSRRMIQQ